MKLLLYLRKLIIEFIRELTATRIISGLFIGLFLYTAFSKVFVYDVYVRDLKRQPWISEYARPLSIILPLLEFGISTLLFLPRTRLWGLYGSLGLMIAFTIYVCALVFTQENLPCSCGGLIRELTWKQHFFFNVFWTLLAILGIWLYIRKIKRHREPRALFA